MANGYPQGQYEEFLAQMRRNYATDISEHIVFLLGVLLHTKSLSLHRTKKSEFVILTGYGIGEL